MIWFCLDPNESLLIFFTFLLLVSAPLFRLFIVNKCTVSGHGKVSSFLRLVFLFRLSILVANHCLVTMDVHTITFPTWKHEYQQAVIILVMKQPPGQHNYGGNYSPLLALNTGLNTHIISYWIHSAAARLLFGGEITRPLFSRQTCPRTTMRGRQTWAAVW